MYAPTNTALLHVSQTTPASCLDLWWYCFMDSLPHQSHFSNVLQDFWHWKFICCYLHRLWSLSIPLL